MLTTYEWTPTEVAWRNRAACDGQGDLFFPTQANGTDQVRRAIAICHQCPVIAECGAYADTLDVKVGVWGGRNHARRRYTTTIGTSG